MGLKAPWINKKKIFLFFYSLFIFLFTIKFLLFLFFDNDYDYNQVDYTSLTILQMLLL